MAEAEADAGLVVAAAIDDNAKAAFNDGDGVSNDPQLEREVGLIANGNGDHGGKENGSCSPAVEMAVEDDSGDVQNALLEVLEELSTEAEKGFAWRRPTRTNKRKMNGDVDHGDEDSNDTEVKNFRAKRSCRLKSKADDEPAKVAKQSAPSRRSKTPSKKRSEDEEEENSNSQPIKRSRGRPRKHPVNGKPVNGNHKKAEEESESEEEDCDGATNDSESVSYSSTGRPMRSCILKRESSFLEETSESEEEDEEDEEEVNGEDEEDKSRAEDDDDEEEEPEEDGDGARARKMRRCRSLNASASAASAEKALLRQLSAAVKRPAGERSAEQTELLREHSDRVEEILRRAKKRQRDTDRKLEVEDPPDVLARKCDKLVAALQKSRSLVVYTGAGISTAANIPDYRGPNGVWTLLDQGKEVAACNLAQATPTFTHMALFALYKKGKLKHIVSQNCDGLHMRSGIPRYAISEVHGNMYVEICKRCRPMRPFVRLFDVTERTSKHRHATLRRCYVCGHSLHDSIVHFGERGSLKWPINWSGATRAAEKADVIICLGSSLKVLRRYTWLWCMDRPPRLRPKLFIVNLQWTPKDSCANIKLNGRCDEVMRLIMERLNIDVPDYYQNNDPLFTYATPLNPHELHTTTRTDIVTKLKEEVKEEIAEEAEDDKSALSEALSAIGRDHAYASSEEDEKKTATSLVMPTADSLPGRRTRTPTNTNDNSRKPDVPGTGKLVSGASIDYKSITWPRDALYLPYEPNFEFVAEGSAVGEDAFVCDCCDPEKQRKRRRGSQTSSDSDAEDEDGEDSEASQDSKQAVIKKEEATPDASDSESMASTASASTSNTASLALAPGWFGKGRRKRTSR